MKMNLYELLGVERTATSEQIRRAYYKLAKSFHPDNFVEPDEAFTKVISDKMNEISKAYKVLMNPEDRAYYDENGEPPSKVTFEYEVEAFLNSILAAVIQDANVDDSTFFKTCEDGFNNGVIQINTQLESLEVYKKSLREILENRCSIGDSDSKALNKLKTTFGYIIEQRLEDLKKDTECFTNQLRIQRAAFELLKGIESDEVSSAFTGCITYPEHNSPMATTDKTFSGFKGFEN